MTSIDYYSIAKEILIKAYPRRVKCLDSPKKSWDEDTTDIWAQMTPNERGWYILFNLVEYWHDWRALEAISPSPEITAKYHKVYNDRRNSYNRDIYVVQRGDKWLEFIESFKVPPEPRRKYDRSYTILDIPAELKIRRPKNDPGADAIRRDAGDDPTVPESLSKPLWY